MTTYVSTMMVNKSRVNAITSALEFCKEFKGIKGFEPVLRFKSEVLNFHSETLDRLDSVTVQVNESLCGILLSAITRYLRYIHKSEAQQSLDDQKSLSPILDELRNNMRLNSFYYFGPSSL